MTREISTPAGGLEAGRRRRRFRFPVTAALFLLVSLLGLTDALTGGRDSSVAFAAAGFAAALLAVWRPAWGRILAWNVGLLWLGLVLIQWAAGERPLARSKVREALARRARGEDILPSVHPQDFMSLGASAPRHRPLPMPRIDGRPVLPLGAPAGTTSVYCREDDGWMLLHNDALGFNNPADALRDPRIVVVGDSFVHGACVGTGHGFVDGLRARGRAVYNLGIAGGGPLTYLALLSEHLDRLAPRRVLWVHTAANDLSRPSGPLSDLDLEMSTPPLRAYLERPGHRQDVLAHKAAIDAQVVRLVEQRVEEIRRRSEDRARRRRLLSRLFLSQLLDRLEAAAAPGPGDTGPVPLAPERRLEIFVSVLERARSVVEAAGAELVFVYLPWREGDTDPTASRVRSVVASQGLPLVDLTPVLQGRPELWARNGGHLSRRGQAAVAAALDDWLRDRTGPSPSD